MTEISEADLATLLSRAAVGRSRVLVAVVGAPGSGKSTLAERLAASLPGAQAIPMDGFHLDNHTLAARGLLERKGAPETFDAEGFAAFVRALATGAQASYPTFDRSADAVVPDGGRIAPDTHIYVVEGNYLLLDEDPWRGLDRLWDMTVALDVAEAELERRLVRRWMDHGHAEEDALRRAHSNDLVNARAIRDRSRPASYTIRFTG
ncbi:AAA family ATPase [Maritimibacter sp. UBA3975]|uniref:AAA family ATPase n=1 Tax=Maritimibacter sp. UBA3975 TaxID=1946833 RepID=UPI000C092505|nr:AAA family ATPase [Maritimibacter sp. UBA3975]MAM62787.1 phosphoribulokinase [Maritimibacter sp.]|tara:strand:+ start:22553 stop:23170 length:618 start_codon:yes stop_codon:yes gene_type:complete